MKIILNCILIGLIVVMCFVLFFTLGMSSWVMPETTTSDNLPDEIIAEIEQMLKFDLEYGETVSVRYFPGMMQGRRSLTITVQNVETSEDFITRFRGEISHLKLTRFALSNLLKTDHGIQELP